MKTLILILTLTVGYSQHSEWDITEVPALMLYDSDSNVLTFYQNFTVINLLALYQEYEMECYNDSSLNYYEFYNYQGKEYKSKGHSLDPGFDPGYIGGRKIWTHKQPTFQGFMEFLERKEMQ